MKLKKYLIFYWTLVKFRMNLGMVYKLNFWLNCLSDIVYYTVYLLVFFTIYGNVESINDWNRYQVMFFLGTFFLIDSVVMVTCYSGIRSIPENIRTGQLDLFITKPVNTLFYVTMNNFNFSFVLNIFYGIAMIIYSWSRLNIPLTFSVFIGYIFLLIMMYSLYFSLFLLVNCASFWFIKTDGLNALHYELLNFTYRIPGVIYKGIWKVLFMGVLPYGLIATIPTQFVTSVFRKENWLMTIFICGAYWALAVTVWGAGLKRYNSASS